MRPVLSVAGCAGPGKPASGGVRSALAVLDALERLHIVDLTHALHAGIPYWPGKGYGPFRYEQINALERDGKAAGLFEMPEHMGTHVDAPSHFVATPVSIDRLSLDMLLRPMVVFDIKSRAEEDPGTLLEVTDIAGW